MNEPWEENLKPDSVKKMDELGKQEDGMTITVSKSFKWNWDDALARVATNILHFFWRSK